MPDWRGRIPLYQQTMPDCQQAFSGVLSVIFAFAMLGVGHSYLDVCSNGAATFLLYGGIVTLLSKGVGLLLTLVKICAEKDGVISGLEYCGIGLLTLIRCALYIGDLVVLIWGTIVVFGAYSTWVYNPQEEGALHNPNFCEYTPFMFAFVLLILSWILWPLMFCCLCCAMCLKS